MRIPTSQARLALAAVVVATGSIAPGPSLAAVPLVLATPVGFECVSGYKPTDGPITVKLLRANGTTRATRTSHSDDNSWFVCFNRAPFAGEKIRMTTTAEGGGTLTRTVKIPDLTAVANRVNSVVQGHAPDGVQLSIDYYQCEVGKCAEPTTFSTHANSNGRYRKDISASADIDGADLLLVSFQSTHGDKFTGRRVVPFMEVRARNRIATGCQPKGTTTIKLRKSDGTLRATRSLTSTIDCGYVHSTFRRNGNPVTIGTGNRISADFASDALVVWPAMALHASGTVVSGRCLKNAPYLVSIQRPGDTKEVYGTTNASGNFSKDLISQWTFQAGDQLELRCESVRGDFVILARSI